MEGLINSTLTILGTTSSYPRKNDCYKVQIKNLETGAEITAEYMPITEYNLIKSIQMLNLSKDDQTLLVSAIEANNEHIYEVASDNAAMDAAENDI